MIKPDLTKWLVVLALISMSSLNAMIFSTSPTSFLPSRTQQLILISGCTGTGKSTFGMEVAISRGILKCISTDTIRQIARGFDTNPAVHRSSYSGEGDAILQWRETCSAVESGVESIAEDSLKRGSSLVLEGVHIVPSRNLLQQWTAAGGIAVGVVLCIPDREVHEKVIFRRGEQTAKGAEEQLNKFNRIREIHDEMVRLGRENNWLLIEQKPILDPRPIDLLAQELQQSSRVWFEGASENLLRGSSVNKFGE